MRHESSMPFRVELPDDDARFHPWAAAVTEIEVEVPTGPCRFDTALMAAPSGSHTVAGERPLAVDWTLSEIVRLHLGANFGDVPSTRLQRPRGHMPFHTEATVLDEASFIRLAPYAVLYTLETEQYQ